jgi:hypothetical protein
MEDVGVESALVTMLGGCDLLISQAMPAKGGKGLKADDVNTCKQSK